MPNYKKWNVAFLFGSGISYSAGLPNIEEITYRLLYDTTVIDDLPRGYEFRPLRRQNVENDLELPDPFNENIPRKRALCFQNFLRIINSEINRIWSIIDPEYASYNYENIYYIVEQISDHERDDGKREYENPAIQPFIDFLIEKYPIVKMANEIYENLGDNGNVCMKKLSDNACKYVKCLVKELLREDQDEITDFEYLCKFFKPIRDRFGEKIDIFTINHDRLLERCFQGLKYYYSDGFELAANDGNRMWRPEEYRNGHLVNLFKLHGGIDWYMQTNKWSEKNCISSGLGSDMLEVCPNILVGTFNKLQQYQRGVFNQLICLFRERLRKVDFLVISGYSFGDKGINTAIVEWLYSNKKNRIVIVHKNPEGLIRKARGAIQKAYRGSRENFIEVKKHITDKEDSATMEDILREIDGVK